MESLYKKKVLIIGATGGIGRETAKLLKSSNADVFITGRNGEKLNDIQFLDNISLCTDEDFKELLS